MEIFMAEPIRILHVVGAMGTGGMETLVINFYRCIDREKVQFDFLVHKSTKGFYDQEIESLGGRIYRLSVLEDKNFYKYLKDLDAFFKGHTEYKVVHCHHNCFGVFVLKAAKKANVPCRIAHSHIADFTKNAKGFFKYCISRLFKMYATDYFACGNDAGKYMFGNRKFKVISNGIDIEKFRFNYEIRRKKRQEYSYNNNFVIIHVGRFFDQKNHEFLIDVFDNIRREESLARLILVGIGPLKEKIESKVKKLGLENHVWFAGQRSDVNELLCASDVFLFPSLYEGLPVTLVEAQCSGIPIVCSDRITEEVKICPNFKMLSLNEGYDVWGESVLKYNFSGNSVNREKAHRLVQDAGYDSAKIVKELVEFYTKYY